MTEGGATPVVGEVTSPHTKLTDNAMLTDADMLAILCRQLHGRNRRYASPAFKQKLAEDVLVSRIGDFRVGERMFTGFSEAELETECTCGAKGDPLACTELAFPIMLSECACQDLNQLIIQGIHPSGSKREGNDVRLNGSADWSDVDVMIQLGPITMLGEIHDASLASGQAAGELISQDGERPDPNQSDDVTVRLEETGQPGFVLLRHLRRPECRHRDGLLFSGRRVKQNIRVIGNLGKTKALKKERFGYLITGGPAVTSSDDEANADLVPCIRLPRWPCEEYRYRRRPAGHPSEELVDRLCRTPALLVPVGFDGSAAQEHEWRLSFSRHEHMTLHALTPMQRDCLAVLKYCNAIVCGPHSDLKGAYLKTALLWLCESYSPDQWAAEGLHRMAVRLMSHLQGCVRSRRLPCYFWSKINMLATRTDDDLERLEMALLQLKAHLLDAAAALVAIFVRYDDSGVHDRRLPERNPHALWQFLLHRAQPRQPEDRNFQDTWLAKENFCSLLSKRSPLTRVYKRVEDALGGAPLQGADNSDAQFEDDWLRED